MSVSSVREAVRGAHVVLTGVTGFLGKVWLSQVLHDLPEIGRVTVIVRDRGEQTAAERVAWELDTSPAFRPLRARHGAAWAAFASEKLRVLSGDCALPLCGLDDEAVDALAASADVVLHCAGLTDFQPEPGEALRTNVRGALHAADLAARLRVPRLLHVSTCYVAGNRSGDVPETLADSAMDAEDEAQALGLAATLPSPQARLDAAMLRAEALGWPNVYTFSKAIAEHLLAQRDDVATTIVRPAVIECALDYPFAGWNEGLNTAGPLAWLLSSPFRGLPAKPANRFDVVPVDRVVRGMLLALAAALRDEPPAIWQLGTSARNPLTFGRAIELNGLAYRKHTRDDTTALDVFLRHLDPLPAPHRRGVGSVPWWAKVARGAEQAVRDADPDALLPGALRRFLGGPARAARDVAEEALTQTRRTLRRVERMLELYRPFTHDNDWAFVADRAAAATAALSPDERALFGFDVEAIDWRTYWVDVEYPGLRKWTFPLLDGRDAPRDPASEPPLRLALAADAAAAAEVA